MTFLEHFRIRFQSASLSFYLLFGCPAANFGSLSRQQSHPSDATYWFLAMKFRPEGHWEQPRNEIGSLSLVQWSFKQGPYEFVKAAATTTTFKFAWNLLETWFFSLSNTIDKTFTNKILVVWQICSANSLRLNYETDFFNSFWSSHRWCCVKKGVLKIFSKFTWKHLCQSLLSLAGFSLQLYQKRNSGTGVFFWILRNV